MSANVISHRAPTRKRAGARIWAANHIGLLIVAAAAIMTASWLAIELRRPTAQPASVPQLAQPAPQPAAAPETPIVEAGAADAPPQRTRRSARRAGVPLDANANAESPGYEILTAAELDGISQARD